MGWGRTILLGDIGNRLDIGDLEKEIADIQSTLRTNYSTDFSQGTRIKAVEAENEQLKVYLAALLRLLVRKDVLTRDELAAFVRVIDPASIDSVG